MGANIIIPSYLQSFTGDRPLVEVAGSTIGECLKDLVRQFPGMGKMLFARDGRLLPYISIYLNGEDAYPDELVKPVKPEDEFYLLYLIGGG